MSTSDAPSGITAAKALSRSAAGISPTRTAVTGSATMPAATKRSPETALHITMAPRSASVDLRPSEPLPPSASRNRTNKLSPPRRAMNTRRSSSTNARRNEEISTPGSVDAETSGGESPSVAGRSRTETRSPIGRSASVMVLILPPGLSLGSHPDLPISRWVVLR